MRIIFFFFTLFILLLAELSIGTIGIYLPLSWMGFFYFAAAKYSYKLIFPTGIIGSIAVDLILYHRLMLPDLFMFSLTVYSVWRYSDKGLCFFGLLKSCYHYHSFYCKRNRRICV